MGHFSFIAVAVTFLLYGLVSKRLNGSMLTPPLLFVIAGFCLSMPAVNLVHFEIDQHGLKLLLEATLVLVLFSDAAKIDLHKLRDFYVIPRRMLLIGMPLTIIVGTAFAHFIPLGLTFCEAALLAAILTPTDAALGQAVVSSERVPEKIRVGLNVESGLNDGIALPIILVLASIASAIATDEDQQWFIFALSQLTLGPLVGIAVGYVGARLLQWGHSKGWVSEAGDGIIALCIAGLCFVLAETVHGNGFIAAFVGGMVFGNLNKNSCHYLFEFVETEGQILTLGTFFIFGSLLLPMALEQFNIWYLVFAILSLTVMRMLPVYLSLNGLRLNPPTTMFLGWFGPRGLASILFVLVVIGETKLPNPEIITSIVFIAVMMSIVFHGLTAAPLAQRYGDAESARKTDTS